MTDAPVEVAEVAVADPDTVAAMVHLMPQLSSAAPPTEQEVAAIVASPATALLAARAGGRIVGFLTLATFRVPSGVRAWIEDVVVDDAARGAGIGAALVQAALAHASAAGARTVDLTSRPSREDANRLYRRLGFVRRETNVYRYPLDDRAEAPAPPPAGGARATSGSGGRP